MSRMRRGRYIFVDRDGTLIQDSGYVHQISDYAPLSGSIDGLRLLQEAGFGIAIVTNQSGIGRGTFTEEQFRRFQDHLVQDFAKQGVRIDASYHCPHTPDAGCTCRKPATGLLERARDELGASLEESFVIGDQRSDIEMARSAGCGAVLVLTGEGRATQERVGGDVAIANDLREAARLILERS